MYSNLVNDIIKNSQAKSDTWKSILNMENVINYYDIWWVIIKRKHTYTIKGDKQVCILQKMSMEW